MAAGRFIDEDLSSMPRPFPWLSRLAEIRRTVANSVRSHYGRRELELLFKISARAAGQLLEMLATERIGTAHLVSRDALTGFLGRVAEAEDVAALCKRIRAERANLTRVKARYLLARDAPEAGLTSLPAAVRVEAGCLTVRFNSVEELLERLVLLANVMNDDPVGFAERCEPRAEESPEAADARYINAEIEWMKREARMPELLSIVPPRAPAPGGGS